MIGFLKRLLGAALVATPQVRELLQKVNSMVITQQQLDDAIAAQRAGVEAYIADVQQATSNLLAKVGAQNDQIAALLVRVSQGGVDFTAEQASLQASTQEIAAAKTALDVAMTPPETTPTTPTPDATQSAQTTASGGDAASTVTPTPTTTPTTTLPDGRVSDTAVLDTAATTPAI